MELGDSERRQLEYLLRQERLANQWLHEQIDGLNYELDQRELRLAEKDQYITQLRRQIEELKQQALLNKPPPPSLPAFVKINLPARRRKKPGRSVGHEAALRAKPKKIDRHQPVPLACDAARRPICPTCRCILQKLKRKRRIVEDLIPSAVEVTCYHTQSGYCPHCRRTVESRAFEQPTAAILRVRNRLPFRQIAQVLRDLPGLNISAAGVVKQIKRLARWLDGRYQALIRRMRASKHVHVDETGWRVDGRNFWLWAFTDPTFTLYHVDQSRGGRVAMKMLGNAFDGTVVADFYGGYDALVGPKQRCLTHLTREIRELTDAEAGLKDCPLLSKLMRWCHDALKLKKRWGELSDPAYEMKASRLEDRLDRLMKLEPTHEDSRRLAKRLKRYRPELTRFCGTKTWKAQTTRRSGRCVRRW